MDFLTSQAEISAGYDFFNVPFRNLEITSTAVTSNLAPFLRRVVFVGEPALET